jgi:hypothetical protein
MKGNEMKWSDEVKWSEVSEQNNWTLTSPQKQHEGCGEESAHADVSPTLEVHDFKTWHMDVLRKHWKAS